MKATQVDGSSEELKQHDLVTHDFSGGRGKLLEVRESRDTYTHFVMWDTGFGDWYDPKVLLRLAPEGLQVDTDTRTEVEKRISIAMKHSQLNPQSNAVPMLKDTTNIIMELISTQVHRAYQDGVKSVKGTFEQVATDARIDEISRYDKSTYDSREEHEDYIQARIKELKETSPNEDSLGGKNG